ncbi:MAG: hypothetical protein ABIP14_04345, partial [Blastocatellia bacterium]
LQTHPPPLDGCTSSAARVSCGQGEMAELGKSSLVTNFLSDLLWDSRQAAMSILVANRSPTFNRTFCVKQKGAAKNE